LWEYIDGKITIKKRQPALYSFLALILLMLITPTEFYLLSQKAYADGLSVENLPPASVGNRQLSLYLKVNPPILTTSNAKSAYMQFSYSMQLTTRLFSMLLI
jgi:hypothetical protein